MNELTFNAEYQHMFKELAVLEDEAKDIEKRRKEVKAELCEAMDKYGIKQIENDYVKVTYVGQSVSIGVDIKAFQMEEPKKYDKLLKKYNKETVKKPYIRITTK
jgi:hypothetical protein